MRLTVEKRKLAKWALELFALQALMIAFLLVAAPASSRIPTGDRELVLLLWAFLYVGFLLLPVVISGWIRIEK